MVSKKVVNAVLKNAISSNLTTFVNVVLESVMQRESWNDTKINRCLEIIAGERLYTPEDFKNVDLVAAVKRLALRSEHVFDAKLIAVDNFEQVVSIEYSCGNKDDENPNTYCHEFAINQVLES